MTGISDDLARVEALTLALLDGELADAELEELDGLVAGSVEAATRHRELVAQEVVLRGERAELDLSQAALTRIREVLAARVERGAMDGIRAAVSAPASAAVRAIESGWAWLGGRRFWQLAGASAALLLVVATAQLVRTAGHRAEPHEALLYGRALISPGQGKAAFRLLVRDGHAGAPLAGAKVEAALYQTTKTTGGGAERRLWRLAAATDDQGMLTLAPTLAADLPEGDGYELRVSTRSDRGQATLRRRLQLKRSYRVMLTCDKPLYQPGQTIHLRALVLDAIDLRPASGRKLSLTISDAKGNKVFSKRLTLSRFGIAAADFVLADQVNQGRYTLAATVGDAKSERAVTVKRYRLPRFRIELATTKRTYAPGDRVEGELLAAYTFGKPVAGARVRLRALSLVVDKLKPVVELPPLRTNGAGRVRFALRLPRHLVGLPVKQGDAPVTLEAEVTDSAGHRQRKAHELTVTERPLRIAALPESGKLVAGVDNRVYLVTAYADGRPAQTEIAYRLKDGTAGLRRVRTSAAGVAEITIRPARASTAVLALSARDTAGLVVVVDRSLSGDYRPGALLLRSDRALYRGGETVRLEVLSAGERGRVFVDVVKDRRTMLTQSLTFAGGRAELALDLPAGLFGTLELHAYRVARDGSIVGDARVIQVNRPDQLKINAKLDRRRYKPAGKAVLEVAVRRADGSPAQVALGLAGVDEAVFALHELQPGLARVYFTLQQELLKPRYQIQARVALAPARLTGQGQAVDPRAGAALFAAAEGKGAAEHLAGKTYREQDASARQERLRRYHQLWGGLAICFALVILLLVAPLLAYGASRLGKRRASTLAAEIPAHGGPFFSALSQVTLWWVLALLLPLLGPVISGVFWYGRTARWAGSVLGLLVFVGCLASLAIAVVSARRSSLAAAVPRLRAALTAVPAALLCLPLLLLALVASQDYPRGLPRDVVPVLVLSVLGLVALVAAVLPMIRRSLMQPTSLGRLLLTLFGRLALVIALPLLGVVLISTVRMGAAPEMLQKASNALAGDGAAPVSTTEESPGALKAPARVRRHFPETLLWKPQVITDAQGKARVEIPLADSITTWRLSLDAVSGVGELGATTVPLQVFQPFFVEPELPVALTQGDEIEIPVAVYSYLDRPQTVRLDLGRRSWFRLVGPASRTVRLAAKQVTSVRFRLVALEPGEHAIQIKAHGSELADAVERKVRVAPNGRRVVQTINGRLDGKRSRRHQVTIPRHAIAGASDLLVKLHPGAFSQVVEGLDAIFAMPYGCFEQTSSTTYPNVLVLDYMRRTKQVRPEVELKALRYINLGYQRLLSFEVKGGGFEWFGKTPAHNVLTAYGLMEFADMARVYPQVDPAVIARTRRYLLSQQQDDGSWRPTSKGIAEGAINRYRGQSLRTTAYITWAMLESLGDKVQARDPRLDRALALIARRAASEEDPYTLATCANALVAGKRPEARAVLHRLLARKQRDDKHGGLFWRSKAESVTHSRGPVLAIETTALAAYALLRAKRDAPLAHQALAWLVRNKDARGTWHSTQATVLALRALLAGTGEGNELSRPVRVEVAVAGKRVRTLDVTPETADVVRLVSLTRQVKPGDNAVTLSLRGEGTLAYQVVATHYAPWPATQPPAPREELAIDVAYDSAKLAVNDRVKVSVTLRHNRPGAAKMLIADLGLPPGFAVISDGLESLKEQGLIARYSLTGRQLTLYIRELQQGKPLSLSYELRAKQPVKAVAPRSRLYKYYEPEVRAETRPVKLTVL